MYDIKAKENQETIKEFENHAINSKLYTNNTYLKRVCDANAVSYMNYTLKSVPASDLEKHGYGSKAALLRAKKQEDNARNNSIRNTIAWTLSENTHQTMRENATPRTREIIEKQKALKEIQDELITGNITYEEAEQLIKNLNLGKNDERDLLSFYKRCWDISGTEEWKQALRKAVELTEIYNQQGIDGIEDEDVKERLILWEQENGKKYSVVANMMKIK